MILVLVLAMHIMHTMAWQRVHKMHGQSVPAPFTARTSEACHRPMTRRRLSACLASWARAAIFFSANEDCHPPIFQPIIWRVF